jgi:hypothetical protein
MTLCDDCLDQIPHTRTDSLVEPEEFLKYAVSRDPLERSSDAGRGLTALINSDNGARIVVESERLDRFRLS